MGDSKKIGSYAIQVVIGINILFTLLLLLSYIAPYMNPNTNSQIPFLGLTYPIALVMNFVFIMVWGFMKSKWFFLSTSIVLFGLPFHLRVFSINLSDNTIPQNANTLKVMSYNVRLFGYYDQNSMNTKNGILNYIRREDPDVLCLQEFFNKKGSHDFNTLDSIYTIMSIRSHHEKSKFFPSTGTHYGISLFSKYPIVNKGTVHHKGSKKDNLNYCIFADIVKKKDTIRVYNVHFQSIKLETDEYVRQTNMTSEGGSGSIKYKSAISKLNRAFKIRSTQSTTVKNHIDKSPYKTVICGDFNDTPISYTYQVFNNDLTDAFRNTSNGFGTTYSGYLPAGRIDYIFHSKSLNSAKFSIQKEKLSDHFAISCTLF
ncbi:endonuclease/exonuclease/phosphatase family protein [Crocinitomicaceae bacterium]|nr:endonuclease/exonuclease/phosphatase family protein [Crocinitomicaceae bacterium]